MLSKASGLVALQKNIGPCSCTYVTCCTLGRVLALMGKQAAQLDNWKGCRYIPGDASRQLNEVLLQSQQLAKGLEALRDH